MFGDKYDYVSMMIMMMFDDDFNDDEFLHAK